MNTSDAGLALIQDFEGLRQTAYRDSVGVLTIGWGHTGPDVVQGMTIDRAEAERLLRDDLHDAERAIQRLKVLSLIPHLGMGTARSRRHCRPPRAAHQLEGKRADFGCS
ncbi:lysozyme [Pseudomonas sp. 2FE]|uniref:lysozyme n=1 Tax=Pseudomonas sp. 2FE TaxID=2502190 RepID=UPI0010F8C4C8|nr:lysozyme [Pseudomonas sp. 2FE]